MNISFCRGLWSPPREMSATHFIQRCRFPRQDNVCVFICADTFGASQRLFMFLRQKHSILLSPFRKNTLSLPLDWHVLPQIELNDFPRHNMISRILTLCLRHTEIWKTSATKFSLEHIHDGRRSLSFYALPRRRGEALAIYAWALTLSVLLNWAFQSLSV